MYPGGTASVSSAITTSDEEAGYYIITELIVGGFSVERGIVNCLAIKISESTNLDTDWEGEPTILKTV